MLPVLISRLFLGIFEINEDTGEIKITGDMPDIAPENYNLTIRTCDIGAPPQCSIEYLIISVQDEGNNPPKWDYPSNDDQIVDLVEVITKTKFSYNSLFPQKLSTHN